MARVSEFFMASLVLVGIYLFVANWKGTTSIISTGGGQITKFFKTLQARA